MSSFANKAPVPLPGKTPGATRSWGTMAPLQNELDWLWSAYQSLMTDPSGVMGIGTNPVGMAAPFQSQRRLPWLPNPQSSRFQAASARQNMMEQKGSAFDTLLDDFDALLDPDPVAWAEKLERSPSGMSKRIASDFGLTIEDAEDVVRQFVKHLRGIK